MAQTARLERQKWAGSGEAGLVERAWGMKGQCSWGTDQGWTDQLRLGGRMRVNEQYHPSMHSQLGE